MRYLVRTLECPNMLTRFHFMFFLWDLCVCMRRWVMRPNKTGFFSLTVQYKTEFKLQPHLNTFFFIENSHKFHAIDSVGGDCVCPKLYKFWLAANNCLNFFSIFLISYDSLSLSLPVRLCFYLFFLLKTIESWRRSKLILFYILFGRFYSLLQIIIKMMKIIWNTPDRPLNYIQYIHK